ncbi:DUF3085 domain-containing protein [Roseibium sp.]|uniref:DUF3085 domain-containing protein n=1 Tax=Roseibium sp. TaxID=1936156 RepID=UPI003D0F86DA
MFTFEISQVREAIARGEADATANGGFRDPYCGGRPGEGEKPGFWVVGDEGVYVMSNGKLADGEMPFVIYAVECDPKTNPDWWDQKCRHFGGDDGVEFINADLLLLDFDQNPKATHLGIELSENTISFSLFKHPNRLGG